MQQPRTVFFAYAAANIIATGFIFSLCFSTLRNSIIISHQYKNMCKTYKLKICFTYGAGALEAYIVYFPLCPVEITSPVARYDKKCHMSDAEKKSEEVREGKKGGVA